MLEGNTMRHRILTLNNISARGLERLPRERYEISSTLEQPDAILLRSANMHGMAIPDSVRAVGRAGAGVNNIPVAELTRRGIPVFNAPGANANAVKELVLAGLLLAGASHAQLLPGVLPRLPQAAAPLSNTLDDVGGDVHRLSGARALEIRALLRAHRRELDTDAHGAPVVRGEIIAIDPGVAALQALRQAGFTVGTERVLDPLALRVVALTAPQGRDTRAALALARHTDPAGNYDFDHLFWRSASPATAAAASPAATGRGGR